MSRKTKTKTPKRSAEIVPFPRQPRPPSLASLPKAKQRWLREAARAVMTDASLDGPANMRAARDAADRLRVSVALAFASNRRGEASETEVHAWVNANFRVASDIAFALAEELSPEAAAEARAMLAGGAP